MCVHHVNHLLATCFELRMQLKTRCLGVPLFPAVVANNIRALVALHLTQHHGRRPLEATVGVLRHSTTTIRGICNMPTCV